MSNKSFKEYIEHIEHIHFVKHQLQLFDVLELPP